jgi:hypothetical protein
MAVTCRLPQAGGALQNPAYRPADVFENEGFGATRRTPRHFMPDFIGFLEVVPTSVPTIHLEPIFCIAAQKEFLNHLDGSYRCSINPRNSSRPALLVPAKCSVFRGLFSGMPALPVSGEPDARRLLMS